MLYNADSNNISQDIPAGSVHATITDPPYGMEFLGLDWDQVLPSPEIWEACFKAMRPGAFLLAFGHTRIYHRLGVQLEDAGFEIKDCLCWGYASGNPRPLNFDRDLDKAAGIQADQEGEAYEPETDNAKTWSGWANNLKTAWEPIIMAQKPLEGKYIDNVVKYNVGGLNIDECRIPYRDEKDKKTLESFSHFAGKDYGDDKYFSANSGNKKQCNIHPDGRWPANLVWLDPLFVEYDHIFMVPKPSRREKGDYNEHSTVKPVELMERLIRLVTPRPSVVKEDVIVLDPFMGSGTTGVAAKNLERKFIGYEVDKSSFDIAKRRIKERSRDYRDLFSV